MSATFWIEEVEHTIVVPPYTPGQPAPTVPPIPGGPGASDRQVILEAPVAITEPRQITFTPKQIQYSQLVELNFNGLTWPHVSVATLTPIAPFLVPAPVWA
ncbi:MAG: hypothetical protein ACLQBB_15925 [Solirubrobacteraceae bacterium]